MSVKLVIIVFLSLIAYSSVSQNVISGTITSVPSNTPAAQTRITFTNTASGIKYSQLTTNGSFSINLPAGTYQRKIEGIGNYQVLDTLIINSSQALNEQIIDDDVITENTFAGTRSLLWMIKRATTTEDEMEFFNGTVRNNVFEHPFRTGPMNVFANRANIPAQYLDDLDAALADLSNKLGPLFNETLTDNLTEGVSFSFHTDATWPSGFPTNLPIGVTAYTVPETAYPDNRHNKHLTVYFNVDKFVLTPTTAQRAFEKELGVRVQSVDPFGPDFIYLMSSASTTNIHPDEVKIITRINALKDGTVMKKHRDVIITSVPNTIFASVSITAPTNNSTVSYDGAGNFTLTHNRNGQLDADGDAVSQIWKIYKGGVLFKNYSVNHNSPLTINKSDFIPATTYTATVTLTDGVLSVTSPAITFTTPAGTAPAPTIEISGTITSVPSNTPAAQTRITFTNTANSNKYSQLTTNGSFSVNLPIGTYERKIEGIGNYQVLDEVTINGSVTLNEKIIAVEPVTSTVYGPSGQNRSLLYMLKLLTTSYDGSPGGTNLYRVTNQNHWRLYARNYNVSDPESMPNGLRTYFDNSILQITTKIPEITFNEQFTEDLTNGITFRYPATAGMPGAGLAITYADENNSLIYVNRDNIMAGMWQEKVIVREIFCRSTGLKSVSTDTDFVTYYQGQGSGVIHLDEVNVARRMLNLAYFTDMTKHRDVVITSVPNTIFANVSVTAPANTSTVSYDGAGNFTLTHNRNGQLDADGDAVSQTWKIYQNNILYKTYTASHNNAVTVSKTDFSVHTTYTATVTLSDGFLEVTSPAITFSTPNVLPTQAITSPANNATVSYAANNQFEIVTTPGTATDADGDNLTKTISIYVMPLNILVKSVTTANNNQVFVLKSELYSHTSYAIKATLSDGVSTTSEVTSNFTTPNLLPAIAITSPANNATVSYDANNRFEIITSPNTATDGDGELLAKTIEVRKASNNALVKAITTANNNQVFVSKTELEPHTSYTIKATLTDGFGTTAVVSSNFSTPNTLPPTLSITSPVNNATVSYDANDRFEIITTPNAATDADGDNLTKTIEVRKVSNNALVKTVTIANNNQVFVLKTELEAHTAYSIKATLTDGIATTAVVSSNFSTPNTLPQTLSITSPVNNATVSYDANNRFEIITTPNAATDADGDNLTKTIEVLKVSNNALVKTVTTANNNQVFILKTELEAHTAYQVKATLTDGIATTVVVSTNFSTPNTLPPTLSITSPANNATVSYDANNRFEIITTPNAATDADGDNLTKTIEVRKVSNNALVKTVTRANNNQVFVLKAELEPQTNYQIKATLTDGIGTSAQVSSNFITQALVVNTIPTQSIVSPSVNATVSYDANNRFEIVTTPATATDAEGDNLTKTIEVRKASSNALVKTVTTANNNPVFVLKTELEAHTLYTIHATLTDGILTTSVVSSSFSTPNSLPVFSITSPSGGQVISFTNEEIDIVTSPGTSKDADNDELTKNVKVTGPGLDTLISKPNETRIFLKESRLQPNSIYSIELTGTDGIKTSTMVNTTFKTPVIVGVEPTLESLNVYPNPFNKSLTIQSPEDVNIKIISIVGVEILSEYNIKTKTFALDLPAGVYLLILTNSTGTVTRRIVKE